MKRALLLAMSLIAAAGCASQGGGGGGGAEFLDCYTDYCVGYDAAGFRRLYIRTPAGPVGAPRGEVSTASPRAGQTQVVIRPSGGIPAAQTTARMSPIPVRSSSSGRRP